MKTKEKAEILNYQEYVAGWLETSIHDFLEKFEPDSNTGEFALITCLDSNPNPKAMLKKSKDLARLLRDAKPVKNGLLVPTKVLNEANFRDQIFFGFDELWLFSSDKIEPKPEAVGLVGPGRIDQRRLDKLGKWMAANGCSLGLGDGGGMNFLVKAQGIMRYLIAQTMARPEPSLPAGGFWKEDTGEK